MLIFLTGMPASGKSYWMRILSQYYSCTGLDLDNYIESKFEKSIPELFIIGENHFRTIETNTLKEVVNIHKNAIIATGGGAACFNDNMDLMNQSGITIYLETSLQTLFNRAKITHHDSPLLISNNINQLEEKITQLFKNRKKYYEQSQLKVNTETVTLATFAALIDNYIIKT